MSPAETGPSALLSPTDSTRSQKALTSPAAISNPSPGLSAHESPADDEDIRGEDAEMVPGDQPVSSPENAETGPSRETITSSNKRKVTGSLDDDPVAETLALSRASRSSP